MFDVGCWKYRTQTVVSPKLHRIISTVSQCNRSQGQKLEGLLAQRMQSALSGSDSAPGPSIGELIGIHTGTLLLSKIVYHKLIFPIVTGTYWDTVCLSLDWDCLSFKVLHLLFRSWYFHICPIVRKKCQSHTEWFPSLSLSLSVLSFGWLNEVHASRAQNLRAAPMTSMF